jgi:F-type H+-transporting ATPase subunit b
MLTSASLPALLAAAEGGHRGGLTDVDWTLMVSTLVLFGLFAAVLGRFGWKPLLGIIEERERSVREAVEGAHKANAEAQGLLAQHRELLQQAGREREEIVKQAMKDAEALRADLSAKARSESEQILRRAKEQIEREKTQAILELRSQVADLAVEAASKIVASSLSTDAQRKLVEDFISKLPKAAH